jgi:DNA-binding Lrp family transcriptional regulator
MTLKEVADKLGVSHSTAYRLVSSLVKNHIIEISHEKNKYIINDSDIVLIRQFHDLIQSGLSSDKAVEVLKENSKISEDLNLSIVLHDLKRQVEELTKENKSLRDLIQVYLSKINSLEEKIDKIQALPKPRQSIIEKVKSLFKK